MQQEDTILVPGKSQPSAVPAVFERPSTLNSNGPIEKTKKRNFARLELEFDPLLTLQRSLKVKL